MVAQCVMGRSLSLFAANSSKAAWEDGAWAKLNLCRGISRRMVENMR